MATDLVISVGANIRELDRAMKAAAQRSAEAADEIEAKFKSLNPTLGGDFGLGVLKGAIAAISFERITRGIIDANKEIASFGDSARRVGLELGRFQELRIAAGGEGIKGKAFDAGIEGLAEKLNEVRQKETDLSKFLDENNVKYKDRTGEVISTNDALAIAADLISRAATEQDKIKIAEAFGLPKDFVPLLENGAAALSLLTQKAREAGGILDAEVIGKAKEFDQAWESAWASFAANSKAGIILALQGLSQIVREAQALLLPGSDLGLAMGGIQLEAKAKPNNGDKEAQPGADFSGIGTAGPEPLQVNVRKTKTTSLFGGGAKGGGGGGGGGKSDEEQAQDRLERYIETLKRQNSVLDAEVATFGKSNAEKRAAVELAKAQVDLSKLDEASRAKIVESLTTEINLSEQKRKVLANLKSAQDGLNEAQKFFGNAAVDALEDLIINGAKAEDVVKKLAASLAKAALQAALVGGGPLAGLFGTKGTGDAVGGLFGAVFGKATGGGVNAGQVYKVGERGPETFVPTVPGRIIPNPGAGGSGGLTQTIALSIDARGATPDSVALLKAQLPGIVMNTMAEARRRGSRI